MHPDLEQLRCVIMRGGTSKGIYINANELPGDLEQTNTVIRAIFGSPDVRQIDGLGGADTLTSKLAIIGPPSRKDADIDYTFAQVGIDTEIVDYKGNCGNISSGVGPYAIDEGLVKAVEPVTIVKIHLTNTNNIIVAEVPVSRGKASVEGDLQIDGVPGTGAKITLDFADTQGSFTGKLLPTGNTIDKIQVEGTPYDISIVDLGNPVVFIEAKQLNMTGIETPQEIEASKALMDTIEKIRSIAAEMIGLVKNRQQASTESPYIPFFAIVGPPQDYKTFNNKNVKAKNIDLTSRLLFMLKMHKTYPGTGTVCTGAAAKIPGSVVWNVMRRSARDKNALSIGHPSGMIPVEAVAENIDNQIMIKKAAIYRTARRVMDGYVYVRKSVY